VAKMRRIGYMVLVFKQWGDYAFDFRDGKPVEQLEPPDDGVVGFCPIYTDRKTARKNYPGHRIEPITIGFTDNEEDEHGS